MTEAFAVIDLAASILQFIEYGITLTSEICEIFSSASGALDNSDELQSVHTKLESLASGLHVKYIPTAKSDHDIIELAYRCQAEAKRLLRLLRKHDDWEGFRQAARTLGKKDQIEEMQRRLSMFRAQLTQQLPHMVSDQQSNVLQAIQDLARTSSRLNIDTADQLTQLQSMIEELKSRQAPDPDLSASLRSVAELGSYIALEQRICDCLRYETMTMRISSIAEAHAETFEWIFDPCFHIEFLQWLRSENGIYYVSGKPGSGKSTLMKYLCNHPRTHEALSQWAGSEKLLTGSYFFWIAGTEMQKSQHGLLQSLLYDILRQCPSLMGGILPSRWHSALKCDPDSKEATRPWTRRELFDGLRLLSEQGDSSPKICFFIDGLDEYDGDHDQLVRLVLQLTQSPNIKICLSSRPWNVFEDSFGSLTRKLRLQDLTKDDIRQYVQDELQKDSRFVAMTVRDSRSRDLVEEIANKADGVFLWVVLVVRSLKEGMRNADTISILQKRLKKLPAELDKFFRHILGQVEDVYWEGTTQAFEMALAAHEPLSIHTFAVLDEEDPDYAITGSVPKLSREQANETIKDLERRLHARCKGLLELSVTEYDGFLLEKKSVNFLHRTVRDFLRVKDIHNLLLERLEGPFDANEAICKGLLVQLRSYPTLDELVMEDYLEDIAFYAEKMERNSGNSPTRVLDASGQYAYYVMKRTGEDFPIHPIIVSRGLHLYLRQKLKAEPHLVLNGDFRADYLFDAALVGSMTMSKKYQRSSPSPEMIALLLEHGLDPCKDLLGVASPWLRFLRHLRGEHRRASLKEKNIWCQVLTLILESSRASDSHDDSKFLDLFNLTPDQYFDEIFSENQALSLKLLLPRTQDTEDIARNKRELEEVEMGYARGTLRCKRRRGLWADGI